MNLKIKKTLREFFNLPKRISKKYLTNQNTNILGESFSSAPHFWNNLNKYYELLNTKPPDVVFFDLPNVNITTFQTPISISENFDELGNQISKQVSNNIHTCWKQKLSQNKNMNKLSVFFRIQFENGAWRSIKSTEYYNITQLIQLGDNLQEVLQGVQNMEEYDFGNIVAIETVMSFSTLAGGCDIMPHITLYPMKDIGNLKLRSVKSSNNNCGIDGLLYLMKKYNIKNIHNQRSKTIRKKLFDHNNELTIDDIHKVSEYLQVNVDIWTPKGSILKTNEYSNETHLRLFLNNNHYYVLEDIFPLEHKSASYCMKCNMKLSKNHKCPVDRFNHQKRLVHQIRRNYYDYRDPNELDLLNILFSKNQNVIIHSEGGVGKTFLINKMLNIKSIKNKYVLLSPTGIAAQHIGGDTIHSIFGIPIDKKFNLEESYAFVKSKGLFKKKELIVIDEISMVSDILLTQMHEILCKLKKNTLPMGGMRILFSGDFLQLSPITHKYCFETDIFKKLKLQWVELTQKHRFLEDNLYSDMISDIRFGKLNKNHFDKLIECTKKEVPKDITPTLLLPKKKDIKQINSEYFDTLDTPSVKYEINVSNYKHKSYSDLDELTKETEKEIGNIQEFKLGTQVMFTHNLDDIIKNGTRGIIIKLEEDCIHIKLKDKSIYKCKKKSLRYNLKSGFVNVSKFPICYAWAISIHKCQGMTLDCAIIDLGDNIFDFHMVYVALSRVRNYDSLYLINFYKSAIRINPKVLEFLANPHNYRLINHELFQHNIEFSNNDVEPYSMIDMKTIFFDMETYTNKKNDIIPYYNYISVWNMGKQIDTKYLMLGENSSDVNKDTFEYIIGLIEKDCIQKTTSNKLENFFYKQPYTLCAYNGSSFDFHFILNQFLYSDYTHKYQLKHIVKDNKLMSIKLTEPINDIIVLRTHDIYNIIDCSLQQAVSDFTDLSIGKTPFPHRLMNLKPQVWLNNNVKVELEHFYENDKDTIKQQVKDKELVLKEYPLCDKLKEYCKNDVELLITVYRGLDKYLREILEIDVFKFLTANMISHYGFMKNIPKELIKNETKTKLVTHLPRYTHTQELYIREAIIGGKAYPRIKQFKSKGENDYYVYLDISGMYVSIMKNHKFPLQCPHWANRLELETILKAVKQPSIEKLENGYCWNPEWKLPFCILDCEVKLHPSELEPPVGYKKNGKILWDVKPRRQTYSNIAIELILKNGGEITNIYSGIIWNDETDYLFQNWMNKTLELKNKGESTGNNSLRVLGKLLGNSTYGGMLKHDHHMDTQLIRNSKEKDVFLMDHSFDYISQIKDDLYYIGGSLLDKSNYLSRSPIHLGVFILDYSKVMLDEIIQTINPNRRDGTLQSVIQQPLTGDTDSLVIHSSLLPRLNKWIKKENGYLVDELNKNFNLDKDGNVTDNLDKMSFSKIKQAYVPIPKAYAFLFNSPEDKYKKYSNGEQYIVKVKGIPNKDIEITAITNENKTVYYKDLDFKLIDDIYAGKLKKNTINIISNNRIRKVGNKLTKTQLEQNIKLFQLQSEQLQRHLFKTEYSGREELKNGYTVPLGYDIKNKEHILKQLQLEY